MTITRTVATSPPALVVRRSTSGRGWPIEVRWLLMGLAYPPAGLLAIAIAPVVLGRIVGRRRA